MGLDTTHYNQQLKTKIDISIAGLKTSVSRDYLRSMIEKMETETDDLDDLKSLEASAKAFSELSTFARAEWEKVLGLSQEPEPKNEDNIEYLLRKGLHTHILVEYGSGKGLDRIKDEIIGVINDILDEVEMDEKAKLIATISNTEYQALSLEQLKEINKLINQ